ncbi:MAG: V-type ATP synthase subunit A, partial [Deltaproteobacteria bacterium]|nr:V-type ATP synthase subunit A [Deltaproteobacteria bacterium]
PGGFGTGKTVIDHTIAKFSLCDIVIFVGCGERGNEMTEVLSEFPKLKDPVHDLPLSERTVLIVNTSNMPVAAREASIFTGITIAEYFRDMGYSIALLTDSISRWAEALREISSRLEEIPGEEGYPPYLSTRLGEFYERAGKVECLGDHDRTGSVTIISSVSPPGGDFSEPVTQTSLRFSGAFWALDKDLAHRRHFPAVNWNKSFTLYYDQLREWYEKEVSPEMEPLRTRLLTLLEKEAELAEVAQVIGLESLQDSDRITLEFSSLIREGFLRQNVFDPNDSFSSFEKQLWILKVIFGIFDVTNEALARGVYLEKILDTPMKTKVLMLSNVPNKGFKEKAEALLSEMIKTFNSM